MLSRHRKTLLLASTLVAGILSLRDGFTQSKKAKFLYAKNAVKKSLPTIYPTVPRVHAYSEDFVKYLHHLNKDLGLVAPGLRKSILIDDVDYLVEYSKSYTLPLYTMEILDIEDVCAKDNCCYSNWVAKEYTANDLDYFVVASRSDYMLTRAQMAAECNHLRTEETYRETKDYINAVPQHYKLNSGAWSLLEGYVRSIIKHRSPKKVCVITGPIVDKNPSYLGICKEIAIPEAFFKIIIEELTSDCSSTDEGNYRIYSFILPNLDTDQLPDRFEDRELYLQQFLAPISAIEEKTNLKFFPNLSKEKVQSRIEEIYQDREDELDILFE